MFTRRLGCTMSSFIRASRSVPPARTSALSQVEPSRLTACSGVVGLAYSNDRITHLPSDPYSVAQEPQALCQVLAARTTLAHRWRLPLHSRSPRQAKLRVARQAQSLHARHIP